MKKAFSILMIFSISSMSWAALPNQEEAKHGMVDIYKDAPSSNPIIVDRAVLLNNGQPVCIASLSEDNELAPKFIRAEQGNLDGQKSQAALPVCDSTQVQQISQVAQLADNKNQVAALPFVVGAAVVCAIGASVASLVGYVANKHMDTGDRIGVGGLVAAIATPFTTVGATSYGTIVAMFGGGAIGVVCAASGLAVAYLVKEVKQQLQSTGTDSQPNPVTTAE